MQTFSWNGERYELLNSDDFLVGEGRWVERLAKTSFQDMGTTDSLISRVIVTLKRKNIHLKWADFDDMKLGDFELIDEPDEDEDEDPTATGGEAGQPESVTADSSTG